MLEMDDISNLHADGFSSGVAISWFFGAFTNWFFALELVGSLA